MYIDFKELNQSGLSLEFLVQEILRCEGLDVHWEGAGNDNGKDLIATEEICGTLGTYRHRWVVQCKHTAHGETALGTGETLNVLDTCHMANADGYLLICTTHLSSRLIEKLDSIEANHKIRIKYWDALELENRLLKPCCFALIDRYFPVSSDKIGIRLYNSVYPSVWLATYKAHLFNLSSRVSNLFPPVKRVETLIGLVDEFYQRYNCEKYVYVKVGTDEAGSYAGVEEFPAEDMIPGPFDETYEDGEGFVKRTGAEFIRVRSIWHDDKNNQYLVHVDYLHEKELPLIELEHFKAYFRRLDIVDGCGVNWEFCLHREYFESDHFNPNHADYYKDRDNLAPRGNAVFSRRVDFDVYDDRIHSFSDLLII